MDECIERLEFYCDKIASEFRKIPQNYKLIEQYGHIDQEVHDISDEYERLKIKLDELGHRINSSKFGLKMIEVEIDEIKERQTSQHPCGDLYLP